VERLASLRLVLWLSFFSWPGRLPRRLQRSRDFSCDAHIPRRERSLQCRQIICNCAANRTAAWKRKLVSKTKVSLCGCSV